MAAAVQGEEPHLLSEVAPETTCAAEHSSEWEAGEEQAIKQ